MLLDMLNSNIIEEVPSEEISRAGPVFICLIDRLLRRMLSPRKLGQFVCLCFTSRKLTLRNMYACECVRKSNIYSMKSFAILNAHLIDKWSSNLLRGSSGPVY